jgi:hypothetical protein
MAFFEEQTRNLSDRSVELINEYEADDDKIYRLSQFDFTCTMSSSTGDGKRRDEYYDTCRALMKIFLNNCPVVDDGFGHRVLFTEKENGKLGTWGCCIHYTMANFAKREKRDPELIRRIRKFGIDLIDSKKAIF